MNYKRKTFDASFKRQAGQMIREQGLSVAPVCRNMSLARRRHAAGWRSSMRNNPAKPGSAGRRRPTPISTTLLPSPIRAARFLRRISL